VVKNISVVICLSHQLLDDLSLSHDSFARLKKACSIFFSNSCNYLVTTGWKYRDDLKTELSDFMAKIAVEEFKLEERNILQIKEAKDTVGEALFLKKFLKDGSYDVLEIFVVTSNWHIKRAKEIFSFIFGAKDDPEISFIEVKGDNNLELIEKQNKSLDKFFNAVKDCNPKDFNELYNTIIESHELYSNH
jgi:hypothetical protein